MGRALMSSAVIAFPNFFFLKLAEADSGAETFRLLGVGAAPIAALARLYSVGALLTMNL